jgi:hypothetical protein
MSYIQIGEFKENNVLQIFPTANSKSPKVTIGVSKARIIVEGHISLLEDFMRGREEVLHIPMPWSAKEPMKVDRLWALLFLENLENIQRWVALNAQNKPTTTYKIAPVELVQAVSSTR